MSDAIRQAVDRRFARLRALGGRLRELGYRLQTDPDRMVLMARVELERLGVVVIESEGTGFVARELICEGGDRYPFADVPVDLTRFDDRADLEIFLSGEAELLVPDRAKKSFVSGHEAHAVVRDDELFADLTEGISEIVSGLTPPVVDQIWVMDVIVERDDGREVRYRGVGFTGQAFGAPRVLPKEVFDHAYVASDKTHRMLVRVTSVDEESVTYVRLDAERRPVEGDRRVALVGFLANFTQEPALG
jgi:hypothetical protein